jgi:cyclomaltodextrinase
VAGARSWVDHVLWWQVYPLGFTGAEEEAVGVAGEPHRLRRIEGWLDHLVSLGANGLLLGPVFTSATHGYDTTDYFSIDPRLGDDEDLDRLVAACHDRGIRVLLDGVRRRWPRVRARRPRTGCGGSTTTAGWSRPTTSRATTPWSR